MSGKWRTKKTLAVATVAGALAFAPSAAMAQVETPDEVGEQIRGTGASELFYGTVNDDSLSGAGNDGVSGGDGDGDDFLIGEAGADVVSGGPGDDALYSAYSPDGISFNAPASPDVLNGGSGDDFVDSADAVGAAGTLDKVTCGPGYDVVEANAEDRVFDDCEEIHRY